jgi:hypothetical protein
LTGSTGTGSCASLFELERRNSTRQDNEAHVGTPKRGNTHRTTTK